MDVEIKILENIELDKLAIQKMIFISNALNEGWKIEKNDKKYIFTKKDEKLSDYNLDNYLGNFITRNSMYKNDN